VGPRTRAARRLCDEVARPA